MGLKLTNEKIDTRHTKDTLPEGVLASVHESTSNALRNGDIIMKIRAGGENRIIVFRHLVLHLSASAVSDFSADILPPGTLLKVT